MMTVVYSRFRPECIYERGAAGWLSAYFHIFADFIVATFFLIPFSVSISMSLS